MLPIVTELLWTKQEHIQVQIDINMRKATHNLGMNPGWLSVRKAVCVAQLYLSFCGKPNPWGYEQQSMKLRSENRMVLFSMANNVISFDHISCLGNKALRLPYVFDRGENI